MKIVSITEKGFIPSTLEIAIGESVEWVNDDDHSHKVNGDKFDSLELKKGDKFSYFFNKIGTFKYNCSIHKSMKGVVKVMEVVPVIPEPVVKEVEAKVQPQPDVQKEKEISNFEDK